MVSECRCARYSPLISHPHFPLNGFPQDSTLIIRAVLVGDWSIETPPISLMATHDTDGDDDDGDDDVDNPFIPTIPDSYRVRVPFLPTGSYYLAPRFRTVLDRDEVFIHLRMHVISGWTWERLGHGDFRVLAGVAPDVVGLFLPVNRKDGFTDIGNKVRYQLSPRYASLIPLSRSITLASDMMYQHCR